MPATRLSHAHAAVVVTTHADTNPAARGLACGARTAACSPAASATAGAALASPAASGIMCSMAIAQKPSAFERVTPATPALLARHYDELRRLARRIICSDSQRRLLQATELVNEAVLRLIHSGLDSVEEREHLLALAARTMRRVLIDEARRARAAKRQTPPLVTAWPGGPPTGLDVEALDAAIAALEAFSPEHARIVELRFGLGLTVEETARVTGIPERTVKRRWQAARAWLHNHLTTDGRPA